MNPIDKFAQPREIWRDQAYKIGLKLKVEYTDMGKLSREFTAVLVELNTKHPVPKEVKWTVLKTLKQELEEILRNDDQYQTKGTLERFLYLSKGLVVQWERLLFSISNCQELYFLEDTATPILQTDASDYGIGGYVFMVTNGRVRVVRFFSKAFVGEKRGTRKQGESRQGTSLS